MIKKSPIILLIILSITTITLFNCRDKKKQQPKAPDTDKEYAPDFSLKDLSGTSHTLKSYKGTHAVLLDFWATWCGPCRYSMPKTQSHHKTYANRKLKVLAINIREDKTTVQDFMNDNNYTFAVLLDSDGSVSQKYKVTGIPQILLIDKEGVIQYKGHPNNLSESTIEQHLP